MYCKVQKIIYFNLNVSSNGDLIVPGRILFDFFLRKVKPSQKHFGKE
ncbi:hypothetical protein ADICYQ_3270 [Cyclobacterium qasimii M12-11B]|uniref:Uncharacterized protein n=1 Tax=Cyclobacterium qasimii M12-11B TaxID=641524 RepID=S7VBN3_9BACT|nr:hypothetical protein ADICYQ_3270 [Cyclobacterium qasimii M12-11B]